MMRRSSFTDRLSRHLATTFGLGDRVPAPGTVAGSLPAALLWWGMTTALQSPALRAVLTATGVVVLTIVALWASDEEARRRGRSDPGPVVIDEVAGQWVTYLVALPLVPWGTIAEQAITVAAGFVLFRVWDVIKPWPVGRLERLPGGIGIVADDLAAGLMAGLVMAGALVVLY